MQQLPLSQTRQTNKQQRGHPMQNIAVRKNAYAVPMLPSGIFTAK